MPSFIVVLWIGLGYVAGFTSGVHNQDKTSLGIADTTDYDNAMKEIEADALKQKKLKP